MLLSLAATSFALALSPPQYRVDGRMFVRTPGDVSQVVDGGDSYAQGRARTYAALAGSPGVAERVIAHLGLQTDPAELASRIDAVNEPGTVLIDFAVTAPSGTEALCIAQVLTTDYADMVRGLEAVPGSLVPRAELVIVDPPGSPTRVVAQGVPIALILLIAAGLGALAGATVAVIHATVTDDRHVPCPNGGDV